MPSPNEVTQLLLAWSQGDRSALEELIPLVYDELHKMARRYMIREQAANTLQTTALVNEAYLRMVDMRKVQWQNRAHFFAVSAQLMRRILVDFARSRNYQKRGGGKRKVTLDDALEVSPRQDADLVLLDDALNALAIVDDRKRKVVELRFFGGLTVEETAHVLEVSSDTVMRDWKMAKVWLLREMSGKDRDEA
ncbi:MAG TPA: sigma-70 family RNA polymerase sigma factor [Blastocatellia bacterium]|nr:sigma-70 family RNA polymerase sigma factor [Blastocatellia bacterium]